MYKRQGLVTAIIGSIPQIIDAGVRLLVSLIQNLPTIITTICLLYTSCVAASQIYSMLMDYKGAVTVKIDGIAASAASVIAMA